MAVSPISPLTGLGSMTPNPSHFSTMKATPNVQGFAQFTPIQKKLVESPNPNAMKLKKYNPILKHTEEGSAE